MSLEARNLIRCAEDSIENARRLWPAMPDDCIDEICNALKDLASAVKELEAR